MACLSLAILTAFFLLNTIYDKTHSGYMEVSSSDNNETKDPKDKKKRNPKNNEIK